MEDDETSRNAPRPGELLDGRFELREAIGRGASGQVFAALDRDTGEEVAVKVLEQGDARVAHEARALSRLSHPNVVALRAFGTLPGGRAYLALERLSGHTLDQWLRRRALTPLQLGTVLARLASALDAAHAVGLVHGDVRPANVFLEAIDGRVKLLDFGIVQGQDPKAPTPDDDRRALARLAFEALTGDGRSGAGAGPLDPVVAGVLEEALVGRFGSATAFAEAYSHAVGLPWPPSVPGEQEAQERESFSAGRGSGLPAEPPSWMPEEPLRLSSVPPPPPAETTAVAMNVVLWAGVALALAATVLVWWLL